ncbi:MAG TPA: NAD(P)/FAD-dependent oxidoreductase [Bacteroidia bacterium]
MITTDICIIGAGPVGLFTVFECGLLKMRCHLVDSLAQVGGQLTEIYPKKPIYDIPGFPSVLAGDLIDGLMKQIEPFNPTFTLGQRVEKLEKLEDGSFLVHTNKGETIACKAVAIAAGLGCFEPRKPNAKNLEQFEGKGVEYMVLNPEDFRNKKVVLAGGGDSALDWAIYLSDIAQSLTLVHRSKEFRGAPDSVEKVFKLHESEKINLVLDSNIIAVHGDDTLKSVEIEAKDKSTSLIDADYFIPLFGLSPKLGPIAEWGLNIDKNAIEVNTYDYSTNIPGIYAIGDINTYPGKLKLILCGFHEGTLMAQSAFKYMYPDEKLSFKYTTVNGVNPF